MTHASATPEQKYVFCNAKQWRKYRAKTLCGKTVSVALISSKPECKICAAKIVPITL